MSHINLYTREEIRQQRNGLAYNNNQLHQYNKYQEPVIENPIFNRIRKQKEAAYKDQINIQKQRHQQKQINSEHFQNQYYNNYAYEDAYDYNRSLKGEQLYTNAENEKSNDYTYDETFINYLQDHIKDYKLQTNTISRNNSFDSNNSIKICRKLPYPDFDQGVLLPNQKFSDHVQLKDSDKNQNHFLSYLHDNLGNAKNSHDPSKANINSGGRYQSETNKNEKQTQLQTLNFQDTITKGKREISVVSDSNFNRSKSIARVDSGHSNYTFESKNSIKDKKMLTTLGGETVSTINKPSNNYLTTGPISKMKHYNYSTYSSGELNSKLNTARPTADPNNNQQSPSVALDQSKKKDSVESIIDFAFETEDKTENLSKKLKMGLKKVLPNVQVTYTDFETASSGTPMRNIKIQVKKESAHYRQYKGGSLKNIGVDEAHQLGLKELNEIMKVDPVIFPKEVKKNKPLSDSNKSSKSKIKQAYSINPNEKDSTGSRDSKTDTNRNVNIVRLEQVSRADNKKPISFLWKPVKRAFTNISSPDVATVNVDDNQGGNPKLNSKSHGKKSDSKKNSKSKEDSLKAVSIKDKHKSKTPKTSVYTTSRLNNDELSLTQMENDIIAQPILPKFLKSSVSSRSKSKGKQEVQKSVWWVPIYDLFIKTCHLHPYLSYFSAPIESVRDKHPGIILLVLAIEILALIWFCHKIILLWEATFKIFKPLFDILKGIYNFLF